MPSAVARLKRSLDLVIPFALLIAALFLWIDAGQAIRELRSIVFDSYQRLLPRPYLDPPVRIVDIDEPSLRVPLADVWDGEAPFAGNVVEDVLVALARLTA